MEPPPLDPALLSEQCVYAEHRIGMMKSAKFVTVYYQWIHNGLWNFGALQPLGNIWLQNPLMVDNMIMMEDVKVQK